MELINFSLDKNVGAIGIHGFGFYWDMHNYAALECVSYDVKSDKLELQWSVPKINNPWGDNQNQFRDCLIRFSKLNAVKITGVFPEHPKEKKSLESMSLVSLQNGISGSYSEPKYRVIESPDSNNDFGIWFSFYGGLAIEIFSQSAELVTVN